jgi:multiple sugar transport system permease protein
MRAEETRGTAADGVATGTKASTSWWQRIASREGLAGKLPFALLVIAAVSLCLAPFLWTFVTSLKGNINLYAVPITYLPDPPTFVNYSQIFRLPRFTRALLNSAIVATCTTTISLLVGTLAAYAIARLTFRFKNVILGLILTVSMFPGIVIVAPLFRQFREWNLLNNYFALILPGVTFTLPLCIWTLNAFFRDLPRELEESALVDGCTRMQALVKIIAPLAAPGVFTAAILIFIAAWNEFLFARTFMSLETTVTAPVAIAQFEGSDITVAPPWGQIAAASVVTTLPLIALVLIFQRRIISGLTSGAVKG